MPRNCITETQVAEASLRLRAEGHPVTTVNIRREIGRGSYSTISTHLESLAAKEPGRPKPDESMPPDVRAICDAHTNRTWRVMQKHAQAKVEVAIRPYQTRIISLVGQLQAAKEARERLDWEAMQIRHELRESELTIHNTTRALEIARQELAIEQALRKHVEDARRPGHGTDRTRLDASLET